MNPYLLQLKNLTLNIFQNEPVRIILFGSRARGDNTPNSDVDIGIIPLAQINSKFITLFREKVENLNIPFKVDIVNLNETSDEFRNQALSGAVMWRG